MSNNNDALLSDDLQFEDAHPITFSDDLAGDGPAEETSQASVPNSEQEARPSARFSRPAKPRVQQKAESVSEQYPAGVDLLSTDTSEQQTEAAPAPGNYRPQVASRAPRPTRAGGPARGNVRPPRRTGGYARSNQESDYLDYDARPQRRYNNRPDNGYRSNNGNGDAYRAAPSSALAEAPESELAERWDMPLEERIQEDLKLSFPGKGILEVTPSGFGFLRPRFTPSPDDIYVSQSQIHKFWLRPGDDVEGLIRPPKDNEKYHGLLKIEKVNGRSMTEEESRTRKRFNYLTSMYPDKQIRLETDKDTLSTRIMDLFAPIGFGQRGMIVSPPKAGKTTLLKNIAAGILANHPDAHLIAILIGERPEEVTDMTRSIDAEVVSSHFDQSPRDQIRAAEIGLERAKRLVEEGKDVVVLLDSITRLARAYNMAVNPSGRTLSGGFDPAALYPAKKFLGAARNCEEGGSLTIIGTALVSTESRMDDLIYEEFKGTGNMELHLDRSYAEKRIYPAIDIERSGTRHDELLLTPERMDKIATLRRMMALLDKDERIIMLSEKLKKTESNDAFLEEIAVGK